MTEFSRRDVMLAALGGVLPAFARAADAPASPLLGALRAITFTAPDVDLVAKAWTEFMGYRLLAKTKVSRRLARSWGAPDLAGRRIIILGPDSGENMVLRYVEQPTPEGLDLSETFGWRMAEFTVQDSVALYERLKDSPFKVPRPPGTVPTFPYLRPLGATGPAGERLALTWITEKRPDLAEAKSFVGRCFMAVQTAPDLPGSLEFFKNTFGRPGSPIRRLPTTSLSVITLEDGSKIEVDQHKPGGRPRERVGAGLPPGLAIASFECRDLSKVQSSLLADPVRSPILPFEGKDVATLQGPAGELIELIGV